MKNCLAFLDDSQAAADRLDFAIAFATPLEAHLTAFAITPEPAYMYVGGSGAGAAVWAEQLERSRLEAAAAGQRYAERLQTTGLSFDARAASLQVSAIGRTAAQHARYADLAIVGYSADLAAGRVDNEVFEGVLFESGRPLLVVATPSDAAKARRRIMVAWDGGRQAARAVGDALPLLKDAEDVSLVVVDPQVAPDAHGEEPGGDMALTLARHGVKVDVHQIPRAGRTIGAALQSHARDWDAGMIVMGGFGHSMLRESLFGGVSQELLESGDVPLFMAH